MSGAAADHFGGSAPGRTASAVDTTTDGTGAAIVFAHEAFFYAGDEEYLAGTVPFIAEGLDNDEPVLVAVPAPRLELLRSHFDGAATGLLRFADMEELGRNPAWIIPVWAEFILEHAGNGAARGIGEPTWAGRSEAEQVECDRHEALLNLAFRDASDFKLLCPYDTGTLDAAVLDAARRNHPRLTTPGATVTSSHFQDQIPVVLDTPLPPVPSDAVVLAFDLRSMTAARHHAAELAGVAGLSEEQLDALTVAVSEAMSNSVDHGGGSGQLSLWNDGSRFLCEISDRGLIADPLAGRRLPTLDSPRGRGLWLMNQLCDLVQIRSTEHGQLVRLHFSSDR